MTSMRELPPAVPERVEGPQAITPPSPLPIEVLDPRSDPDRHAGRASVRHTVLSMMPVAGEQLLLPGPMGSVGVSEGAFWGLRAKNGLTIALRAASFATALAARRDAVELLTRAADFEYVEVQSTTRPACSAWIVLDGRVVMVSGQAWGPRATTTLASLRATLTTLPRL